ncbi:Vancomycin resistance protein YoaR, contains peptidoglycan-binding and VanW domains [Streptomyces zhaozhouensis]|uniref:Vancomycin resistance protein YoaR, contains peptidoglycan-binding and VanW domains n=1 Tax=Streptomyces zhaozhouensis TaxID=1300267 RepID=A0A286DST9_9ACTN|nr:Vancomycin resistance protein YoaR, contains peptidoglycan-binding and VanW domains [Streptomyces zhaozhouensis]
MAVIPPIPAHPPRTPRPDPPYWQRWALWGGAGLLVVVLLYLLAGMVWGGRIASGTTVLGVDIGGLSEQAATERLNEELGEERTAPIRVVLGERDEEVHEVDPEEAGLLLDVSATVERASRPGVLGQLLGTGGGALDPVVVQHEERSEAALAGLAEAADAAVTEGAVAFKDGAVRVTEPTAGSALEVGPSVELLRDGYLRQEAQPVRLPVSLAEPRVDEAEVARAVAEFAEPAMSGPVLLRAEDGGAEVSLSPTVLGDHLTLEADDAGRLEPRLDEEGLVGDERVVPMLEAASTEPSDATLSLAGGEVVASGGGEGREVDLAEVGPAVLPLLTGSGAHARTGVLPLETVEPTLSEENFRELGVVEEVSSFTVEFEPAAYRITNIGRAAELINGSLVLPDEVWSFNETVGERTPENGFVEGVIILDDQYTNAQGGGVSAVATTVFNAMFFAGVEMVEYGAHSFYIERYPEGREATVAWGSLDLRFRNDSGNALYILASADDSSVTITFLGTKRFDEVRSETGSRENVEQPESREGEGEECVPQPPLEGFDVTVERIFVRDGSEVDRQSFDTHYVPRDEVRCPDA